MNSTSTPATPSTKVPDQHVKNPPQTSAAVSDAPLADLGSLRKIKIPPGSYAAAVRGSNPGVADKPVAPTSAPVTRARATALTKQPGTGLASPAVKPPAKTGESAAPALPTAHVASSAAIAPAQTQSPSKRTQSPRKSKNDANTPKGDPAKAKKGLQRAQSLPDITKVDIGVLNMRLDATDSRAAKALASAHTAAALVATQGEKLSLQDARLVRHDELFERASGAVQDLDRAMTHVMSGLQQTAVALDLADLADAPAGELIPAIAASLASRSDPSEEVANAVRLLYAVLEHHGIINPDGSVPKGPPTSTALARHTSDIGDLYTLLDEVTALRARVDELLALKEQVAEVTAILSSAGVSRHGAAEGVAAPQQEVASLLPDPNLAGNAAARSSHETSAPERPVSPFHTHARRRRSPSPTPRSSQPKRPRIDVPSRAPEDLAPAQPPRTDDPSLRPLSARGAVQPSLRAPPSSMLPPAPPPASRTAAPIIPHAQEVPAPAPATALPPPPPSHARLSQSAPATTPQRPSEDGTDGPDDCLTLLVGHKNLVWDGGREHEWRNKISEISTLLDPSGNMHCPMPERIVKTDTRPDGFRALRFANRKNLLDWQHYWRYLEDGGPLDLWVSLPFTEDIEDCLKREQGPPRGGRRFDRRSNGGY